MKKPIKTKKIIRIKSFKIYESTTMHCQSPPDSGIVLFGLGFDNKMYTWDGVKRKWVLFGEDPSITN